MKHPDSPLVMGIVNVTPDSFSDGGQFLATDAAVQHGLTLADEGADWLDVGGESTRPGATAVSLEEEIDRVVPVIRGLLDARPDLVVSIDTSKAGVAAAALEAGARIVNDVSALSDPAMPEVIQGHGVILMHMRGTPRTMQRDTVYADLVTEVERFLAARVDRAIAAGARKIWIDPGVGFGKQMDDNPRLIRAIPRFARLGPVVIGASRKRFVGGLTGVSHPPERVAGSIGAALAAASLGADVLRVHDVAATHHALTVFLHCMPD